MDGGGFHDSEAAVGELGSGIGDGVEGKRVAVDAGVGPSDLGMAVDEIFQIDLAGEGGEDGDGFESGVYTQPFVQGIANGLGTCVQLVQELTHAFAECGFWVE